MKHIRRRGALAVALVVAAALSVTVAAQRPALEKARLELASDRSAHRRGETARIAAIAQVEQGWHIQSHTPSLDYLIPTVLTLDLPDGWADAKIEYPPHRMWTAQFEPDQPLAVYEGRVRFLATVEVPADWKEDTAEVVARLRYQACDDRQCLPPREATATVVLPIGEDGEPTNEELFKSAASPPVESRPAVAAPAAAGSAGITFGDLLGKLLLGVLGGLILNAMPCVLPVLSLKLVGIVQHAGQDRRAIATGGLATSAGIVASFIALALVAIGVRAAGGLVGWGVQFQNPAFVAFLAIVVVLFCLNLWGVFEVPLPRALSRFDAGGAHDGRARPLRHRPVRDPDGDAVLGAVPRHRGGLRAVAERRRHPRGLHRDRPRHGAPLPVHGRGAGKRRAPAAARRLDGQAQGRARLPARRRRDLAALRAVGAGEPGAAGGDRGRPPGPRRCWSGSAAIRWARRAARVIGRVGAVAAIAGTLFLAARATPVATVGRAGGRAGGGIGWTPFDRARAESARRATARLVFVDVTADWCFTCKANERLILDTREVAAAFARHQVVPMRADWTNQNEEIARFLADYGRYSIPFYLLYRPGAEPHLFPELLTKRDVLRVLDESAAREARNE